MFRFQIRLVALAGLLAPFAIAFAPVSTSQMHGVRSTHRTPTSQFLGPDDVESVQSLLSTSLESSDLLISKFNTESLGELGKSILIVLFFGGG